MADRRFYFWESYAKAFSMLSDEDAGRFIKACCAFAFEGTAPDFSDDAGLALAWEFVRGQIETSVGIGVKRSESGKRGGRPPKRRAKKSTALSTAKTTALSTAESTAESDMNMNMNMNVNVGADASLQGSASAPTVVEGGESDEY